MLAMVRSLDNIFLSVTLCGFSRSITAVHPQDSASADHRIGTK